MAYFITIKFSCITIIVIKSILPWYTTFKEGANKMFFKSNKVYTGYIYAPASGICIPISQVPDPVFSEKVLGEGAAIILTDGHILSPVDGIVSELSLSKHMCEIVANDGAKILIHIGIDTVNLAGEGFNPKVKKKDTIKVGTPLITADLELLNEKGYDLHTPVIITNINRIKSLKVNEGPVKQGEPIITYTFY